MEWFTSIVEASSFDLASIGLSSKGLPALIFSIVFAICILCRLPRKLDK